MNPILSVSVETLLDPTGPVALQAQG